MLDGLETLLSGRGDIPMADGGQTPMDCLEGHLIG